MKSTVPKRQDWGEISHKLAAALSETAITVITSPYYLLYDRNTKSPILAIASALKEEDISQYLRGWLATKSKEAQYVQVAGAVVFASGISSLSWTDLAGHHWSGPACWYASIVLSMTAVLSGAQQTMLLDSFQTTDTNTARQHLCKSAKRPNWTVVFAWQCPLMFLSYSLILYVAGLTSYVASPVASHSAWDGSAKTLVLYAITSFFALAGFILSSRLVHNTLPRDTPPGTNTEDLPSKGDSTNTVLFARSSPSIDVARREETSSSHS